MSDLDPDAVIGAFCRELVAATDTDRRYAVGWPVHL